MIRLLPAAEADLAAVHDWYETQLLGLGETFIVAVETCSTGLNVRHVRVSCSQALQASGVFVALACEAFRG